MQLGLSLFALDIVWHCVRGQEQTSTFLRSGTSGNIKAAMEEDAVPATPNFLPTAGESQSKSTNIFQDKKLLGVDNLEGYARVAKAFIGLNPKWGDGSGFIIADIGGDKFPVSNPVSGGARVQLCTCDCVAGDDGVGCVGWGGVAFRYSSLLWEDPLSGVWTGQLQAYQQVGLNELNFVGNDIRTYPGGPAIYNVACTDKLCDGMFSGVFRQSNKAVSCSAGLQDKAIANSSSCFIRCGNSQAYMDWLDYCEADMNDTSLGFSGYGK